MSLSITQKEQRAVVDAFESVDYDVLAKELEAKNPSWSLEKIAARSAELAAKAAIEAFLRERDKRDQWCLVSSYGGTLAAVGPYPTINKVKEAVDKKKVTSSNRVYIGKLRSHDVAVEHMAMVDAPHPRSAAADEAAKGHRA